MYGEIFSLYYIDGDNKTDCMSDDAVFITIGYGLHPQGTEEHKYSLYHCDVSRNGKYLFETTFSVKDGDEYTDYAVWVEFSLPFDVADTAADTNENMGSLLPLDEAKTYCYTSSPDVLSPTILLSMSTDRFSFTYSAFSSYACIGTYELTDDTLTLRTDDGINTYVFDVKDDTFVFDASRSSEIPKYKYSSGAEPESPVPDGAVFGNVFDWKSTLVKSKYSPTYDYLEFDIDGDGYIEDCLLLDLSNSDEVYEYDISVNENGYIIFSRDGEILAFGSEPDLVS